MKDRPEIPKALVNLKNNIAGSAWPKIRRYLIRYLERKHTLLQIHSEKNHQLFERLLYEHYRDNVKNMDIPMIQRVCIESHLHNVLSTLWKEEYRSDLVCYIADSYATNKPSGNKKYPNL